MNNTYAAYLQSEAWEKKRMQRLILSRKACEACGATERLHVHHLTYERIFREEMGDLMTLCDVHHEAAEEMIGKGVIPRKGDPEQIAEQTLSLIAPTRMRPPSCRRGLRSIPPPRHVKKANKAKDRGRRPKPREAQADLMAMDAFRIILVLDRPTFKKRVRELLKRHPHKNSYLSNAFRLYDHGPARR